MEGITIFVICTLVVILVLSIYLSTFLATPTHEPTPELFKFSTDIIFDPFPTILDITNEHACTGDTLRKCTITDPFSCIGCQSLISSCIHFENDTDYINSLGETTTIPANDTVDDGYCLTVIDIESRCNLFHGDLALIQITPTRPDTMIICNCRNPGLIGNTTVLGACDTPFICQGNVDDLNKPLAEIDCVCPPSAINERLNDIPSCRTKNVLEASLAGILNDLLIPPPQSDILSNDLTNFPATISQNVGSDFLINPCVKCPITNVRIPNTAMGTIAERHKFCSIDTSPQYKSNRNEYFGIPYRRSQFERILAGPTGPDAILGIFWDELVIYTRLESFVQRFVFMFTYENNQKIYDELNLTPTLRYAIAVDDLLLGVHFPIPELATDFVPASVCWHSWPTYSCSWNQGEFNANNSVPFPMSTVEPMHSGSNIVPSVWRQLPPLGLLWGTDPWRQMNALNAWGVRKEIGVGGETFNYTTYTNQFVLNRNPMASNVQMIAYGFRRSSPNPNDRWQVVLYNTGDGDEWLRVQNALVEEN